MRLVFRLLVLLALSLTIAQAPLLAQAPPPEERDVEILTPPESPLVAPNPYEDRPDKNVVLDGNVRLVSRRFTDFEWRYRLDNGSDETITSFSIVVPNKYYDSRIFPDVPINWVDRREQGLGEWKGKWLVSYFATRPDARLQRGKWMEVSLQSNAQLLVGDRKATVLCGTSPVTRLLFPWDLEYFPMNSLFINGERKLTAKTFDVPYPSLSFLPLPRREVDIRKGLEDQALTMHTVGQGTHSGRIFQMTLRTPHPVVATLQRGTIMVPSLKQFDVMIVGRSERVIMQPQDSATILVRGYSISYGRRAPPPRVVLHDLDYHFAVDVPQREQEIYSKILERATRLTPRLDTTLRAGYYDAVVQWALWRAQRILENNPITIPDIERDLSQYFTLRPSAKGPIRQYLQPLEIYQLAKSIWSDTDQVMYDEPPQVIP